MTQFKSQNDNKRAWAWCLKSFVLAVFTAVFLFAALPEARSQTTCLVQDHINSARVGLERAYPGQGIKMAYLRFSDPADVDAINIYFRDNGYRLPMKSRHHLFTMISVNSTKAVHAVFNKHECFIASIYIPAATMFKMLLAALPGGDMTFSEAAFVPFTRTL